MRKKESKWEKEERLMLEHDRKIFHEDFARISKIDDVIRAWIKGNEGKCYFFGYFISFDPEKIRLKYTIQQNVSHSIARGDKEKLLKLLTEFRKLVREQDSEWLNYEGDELHLERE